MLPPSEIAGSKATTDAEGRFTITGVDETSTCLLVSALPAFLWTAPVPQTSDEMEIRLPTPGSLTIRYDIEGDDPEAAVHIVLRPEGIKGLEKVDYRHIVKAPNKGKVTVSALLPADYEVSRVKMPHLGHIGFGCSLDRGVVRVESGKTTEVDFARKTGVPIEGEVIGLRAGDGDEGAYIYVRPPEATGFNQDPDRSQWRLPVFDNVTCGLDGRFRTARISPGFYAVIAEAYETMPKQGPGMERVYRTGWELPKYVGVARVKVPESGKPVKVRIEMKPRDDRTPQPVKN
jgi:hypothetical protein